MVVVVAPAAARAVAAVVHVSRGVDVSRVAVANLDVAANRPVVAAPVAAATAGNMRDKNFRAAAEATCRSVHARAAITDAATIAVAETVASSRVDAVAETVVSSRAAAVAAAAANSRAVAAPAAIIAAVTSVV